MARSNEPAVWALFSAGGVLSAFLLPAVALILTGWFGSGFLRNHDGVTEMLNWTLLGVPVAKVVIVLFVLLCLFHALHRIRFVVCDLGLFHQAKSMWAFFCYGVATILTLWTVFLLFFAGAGGGS